jgi:hypothetical protein
MIDHKIILHILMLHSNERTNALQLPVTKEACVSDDAFIFFPVIGQNYQDKVNALNTVQYLERLRVLYPILWRNN